MCRNVVTEMSPVRNGQTEMSRDRNCPDRIGQTETAQTETARPNRPDLIGQTERSDRNGQSEKTCSGLPYPAGDIIAREEVLNVVILGFIGVAEISVEFSAGDVKLEGMPPDTPSLVSPHQPRYLWMNEWIYLPADTKSIVRSGTQLFGLADSVWAVSVTEQYSSVLVVPVSRNFGQAMKSCRNLICSLLMQTCLHRRKVLFKKTTNMIQDPTVNQHQHMIFVIISKQKIIIDIFN